MSWPNLLSSGTTGPYYSSNWESDTTGHPKRIITSQSLPRRSLGGYVNNDRRSSIVSPSLPRHGSHPKAQNSGASTNRPQLRLRASPMSACGDLEEPFLRPNRNARNTPGSSQDDLIGHLRNVSRQSGYTTVDHRPRSRASNTSRKRSSVQKARPPIDPARKQTIMNQVALYWNECIRIADEEKVQANLEIEKLQRQTNDQRFELQQLTDKLQEESSVHQKALIKVQELEAKNVKFAEEKQKMENDTNYLKGELTRSKERSAVLQEKSRVFRKKLNEAILEQQNLFNIAKESYDVSVSRLKADLKAQTVESTALHGMLEESRKKADQLRGSIAAIRSEIVINEANNSGRVSELEAALKEKDRNMQAKEDQLSTLHNHIFGDASDVQKNMAAETLQGVRELTQSLATATQDITQNRETVSALSTTFASTVEEVKRAVASSSSDNVILKTLENLHSIMSKQLIPAAVNISKHQGRIQELVDQINNSVKDDVPQIRNVVDRIVTGHEGATSQQSKRNDEFMTTLSVLKKEVSANKVISQAMSENIEEWRNHNDESQHRVLTDESVRLNNSMADQSAKLDGFERLLQSNIATNTSTIEGLAQKLADKDNASKKATQDIASQLRLALQEEGNRFSSSQGSLVSELQNSMLALQEQLRGYGNQLSTVEKRNTLAPDPSIAAELKKGRDAIYLLEEQNKLLQTHALDSTALGKRWCNEIAVVDDLRSNLQSIQAHLPQLDGLDDQVTAIAQLNGIINATSSYLNEEAAWVETQADEANAHGTGATATSRLGPSHRSSFVIHECDSINKSQQHHTAPCEGPQGGNSQSSLTSNMRRVTLKSPVGNHSPSPPPSIEQEQMRRREIGHTRPILKDSSSNSSQEAIAGEHTAVETELGRVQHRHRAISISRTTAEQSQEIIKEISSGFLPEDRQSEFFRLPLMVDFEPSGGVNVDEGSTATKRNIVSTVSHTDQANKRIRFEKTTPSDPLQTVNEQQRSEVERKARQGTPRGSVRAPHRRPLRTYSRYNRGSEDLE